MASILDAHEITSESQKPLILLTFSLWHLNWLYNTKRKTPIRVSFVFRLRVPCEITNGDLSFSSLDPAAAQDHAEKRQLVI